MAGAATLVQRARADAGLSCRALAARAGVPASTVSRVEHGLMDPTLTMLRRILAGASKRLLVDDVPVGRGPSLAALAATAPSEGRFRVDWTSLRGFADWARRHPDKIAGAVEDPPARTGTPLDAILASFAEELCRIHGVGPPRWTDDVPALKQRWEPPGTPLMRQRARSETPRTFRSRRLTLARSDLFRESEAA